MEIDNYIPLSYISQIGYCKRRVALIMVEQQWGENSETAKGRIEHNIVHNAGIENRNNIHTIRELAVYSRKMELSGYCDEVIFSENDNGILTPLINKKTDIYPIEYKHGILRNEEEYEMQLCTQAMCIEEMFECNINKGAIFYINSHRRIEIEFNNELRNKVEKAVYELHDIMDKKIIPKSKYSKKCEKCSLKEICMPELKSDCSDYMKSVVSIFKEDI